MAIDITARIAQITEEIRSAEQQLAALDQARERLITKIIANRGKLDLLAEMQQTEGAETREDQHADSI